MAKTPLKKAVANLIRKELLKAAREGTPEDKAIAAAAHSACVWLDSVIRFKGNTPQGIALELGSDFVIYELVKPALIKSAVKVAADIREGEDGKIWKAAEKAAQDLAEKAKKAAAERKARRAARKAEKAE